MKEKLLKYLIYISGIICFYIFISVRILPLFNRMLIEKLEPGYWDKIKYGELYYYDQIKHFREENLPQASLKHQYSANQAPVNNAEIFAFGDSFFDISRPTQYPTVLASKLHKKLHYGYYDFPLQYLNEHGYKGNKPSVLVMGIVERFIPMKFAEPHPLFSKAGKDTPVLKAYGKRVKDFVFYSKSEKLYDALLKKSYLSSAIYSEISTLKFNWFGYISNYTPMYSLNDSIPWLFIHDSVNGEKTSFYYHHSSSEIDNICDNIEDLAYKLKEEYNIRLVFISIPAKYTLYHTKLNNHKYSNFIPRLQRGLKERKVQYIDIYTEFTKADQLLYYGTDAHWNEEGMKLAVDLTARYLKENKLIR